MTDRSTGATQAQGQNSARHAVTLVAAALVELQRAAHRLGVYPPHHPLVPASVHAVQRAIDAAAAAAGADRIELEIHRDRVLFHGEPVEERNAAIRTLASALQDAEVASLTLIAALSEGETTRFVQWVSKLRDAATPAATPSAVRAAAGSGRPAVPAESTAPPAGSTAVPAGSTRGPDPLTRANEILDQFACGVFRGERVDQSAASEGTPFERFATALEWGILEKGASRIGLELLALEATLQSVPPAVSDEILRLVRAVVAKLDEDVRSEMPPVFAEAGPGGEDAAGESGPAAPPPLIEDDPTLPVEPAAYLGERYIEASEQSSRRARGVAIAARLIQEGLSGDETPILAALLRESARELLEAGRFAELKDAAAAARWLRRSPTANADARAEAGRLIDWLRSPDTIAAIFAAADRNVEGPETAIAGVFAATGAEGVTLAFEAGMRLPAGPQLDRKVHLLAASSAEDMLAGFRSLHVRADAQGLIAAIALLRRLPMREANLLAQELTSHADARVRVEAYRTLSAVDRRDGASDKLLERALADGDLTVRRLGLTQLQESGNEKSCQLLARCIAGELGTGDTQLRLDALEALGHIPTSSARDALVELVMSGKIPYQSADPELREAAEKTLAGWNDAPARDALKKWKRGPSRLSALFAPRGGART